MKILLLSDSHGRLGALLDAVEREQPDLVFHLGDLCGDGQALADAYPDLTVEQVAGNCDGWGAAAPEERLVTVGGCTFLLTHGHRYHAKLGPGALLRAGREHGVDAVCYGHTHEAVAQRQPDGLWLLNPGTAGGISHPATCGVVTVSSHGLEAEIKPL